MKEFEELKNLELIQPDYSYFKERFQTNKCSMYLEDIMKNKN